MRLHPHEFIRRFLMHVLPKGFHRIRHYGIFANANRAANIAKARAFSTSPRLLPTRKSSRISPPTCHVCYLALARAVIEVFARGCEPKWRPMPGRIDTS